VLRGFYLLDLVFEIFDFLKQLHPVPVSLMSKQFIYVNLRDEPLSKIVSNIGNVETKSVAPYQSIPSSLS
jgi:hypothetical protein